MATIINTPSTGSNDSSAVGIVFGIIVAILVVGLFMVYAMPAFRGTEPKTDIIKVELPNPTTPNPTTPAN